MPYMISKYDGKCVSCGGRITAGERIFYSRKQSFHERCYAPQTDRYGREARERDASAHYPAVAVPAADGTTDRLVVEWPELRKLIRDGFENRTALKMAGNRRILLDQVLAESRGDFTGTTRNEAELWARVGYKSDHLKGLKDFAPPIREKRRFVHDEEGDEIDLSSAWAGEDNFMTRWTKKDVIPGVKLEFEILFSGFTSADIVKSYQRWIAQAVMAIKSAGIDPEINIVLSGGNTWDSRSHRQLIRVKHAGRAADIGSWSAMLSPAAYRVFGFAAKVLHADVLGKTIDSSIGRVIYNKGWTVKFDRKAGAIVATCDSSPREFPAEAMTAQLRAAIDDLKKG